MRHNNWFGRAAGGHSQRTPGRRTLILQVSQQGVPGRREALLRSREELLPEPKELGRVLSSPRLFLLLRATSQPGAGVRGLSAPAFLKSPTAMHPCSSYSPYQIPQHSGLFLETTKEREWVSHSSPTLSQRPLSRASGGWRRKLWGRGKEDPPNPCRCS